MFLFGSSTSNMLFKYPISICLTLILILNSNILCLNRRKVPCQQNSRISCNHNPFSLIWQIKRPKSPPSYLFGTIHVPYTKVWDSIPVVAKNAFTSSDRIVFELDLLNSSTALNLAKCQLLKNNTKLRDVIPKRIFRRLKRHLKYIKRKMSDWMAEHHKYSRQLNLLLSDQLFRAKTDRWERKGPIWVMMMLNSLTEGDVKSQGIRVLDLYLADEARKGNKILDSVENVQDQCKVFNSLNPELALYTLNQTLTQHEIIREQGSTDSGFQINQLIHHYNCGNLNALLNHEILVSGSNDNVTKQIDNHFRTHLIMNRNIRMAKRISQLIKLNPHERIFFALGAGHFIGNGSIVELLRRENFKIVHLNHDSNGKRRLCNSSL